MDTVTLRAVVATVGALVTILVVLVILPAVPGAIIALPLGVGGGFLTDYVHRAWRAWRAEQDRQSRPPDIENIP